MDFKSQLFRARTLPAFVTACSILFASAANSEFWQEQASGSTASLRGISAVDASTAWASGTGGTILKTEDGGNSWQKVTFIDGTSLDFRAISAFDRRTAIVMSAGPGDASRIYRTSDGGANWTLRLKNADENGFFDALAFWNRKRGLLLGDPVGGRFVVLRTENGGATWQRVRATGMPPAQEGEGAFAASGTCLVAGPDGRAWFGTGGVKGARVFRTEDWGVTWKVAETRLRHDAASAGIFSLAFRDALHGVAVGGDYGKLADDRNNVAITADGGATWRTPNGPPPSGFRSAVAFVPGSNRVVATGPAGTDVSGDGGQTWKRASEHGYHALSFPREGRGWASGSDGRIGLMK